MNVSADKPCLAQNHKIAVVKKNETRKANNIKTTKPGGKNNFNLSKHEIRKEAERNSALVNKDYIKSASHKTAKRFFLAYNRPVSNSIGSVGPHY